MSQPKEVDVLRAQAEIELRRLEAQSPAKDVAGRAIGKHGLAYITLIVIIGVVSSLFLEEQKIAAVMGLLGASPTVAVFPVENLSGGTVPLAEIQRLLVGALTRRGLRVLDDAECRHRFEKRDAFASKEKTLHVNSGRHKELPRFEADSAVRFFARHFGRAVAAAGAAAPGAARAASAARSGPSAASSGMRDSSGRRGTPGPRARKRAVVENRL